MHIYEYLFTAVVIVTMLVAASAMIITIPQPSISVSAKEQLKTTTQKIMTQIVLEAGEPPDWGSNISIGADDLTIFGLAKYSESTREAYVLDPYKVQRLSDTIPHNYYIPPSEVLRLLNLGKDYGLRLEFEPVMDIKVTRLLGDSYEISVSSNQNKMPIVNADVIAKMIYYEGGAFKKTAEEKKITDATGKCVVSFTSMSLNKILVVVVDYYGIRFTKVHVPSGTFVKGYNIGEYIVFDQSVSIATGDIAQVRVLKSAEGYIIDCVSSSYTQSEDDKVNINYVEPAAVAFLALDSSGKLIVAWRDVPAQYSSIPEATSLPFAYSLERNVIIGGSSYTLKLQVWRMSW